MQSDAVSLIRKWSIGGFFVVVILGSLYHYVYDWTGHYYLIGAFVPVNESVWEHLKLGLWGVITFSIFEYTAVGRSAGNYFLAKAIGVWIISLTILFIYYFYTMFTEDNILILDIASYVIGVLLCQLFCFWMLQTQHRSWMNRVGLVLLAATIILFVLYTYQPPHREIFRDKNTDTYGTERMED